MSLKTNGVCKTVTLKIEEVSFPKMSVTTLENVWCPIPEDDNAMNDL
jgi:hypothetical protein